MMTVMLHAVVEHSVAPALRVQLVSTGPTLWSRRRPLHAVSRLCETAFSGQYTLQFLISS